MDAASLVLLALIFVIAVLYSSVGQAGGSGYLAAMALIGMAPVAMKPTALCLNIVVALIATVRFTRAGYFSWRLLWPFALGSVPLSFIGGVLVLPGTVYRGLVGMLLLFASAMLLFRADKGDEAIGSPAAGAGGSWPSIPVGMMVGGGIGLLSGMIGIGGGIFLSPVVLLRSWAGARQTSALAAPFILVNSVAALAGHYLATGYIPAPAPMWAAAAAAGGLFGAGLGARRLSPAAIRKVLAAVLLIAAVRLILSM